MIESQTLFDFFGPWAAALVVLVGMLTYFMRRNRRLDDLRAEAEKMKSDAERERELARDKQTESLIASMRDSINLLARAVDRFESFEREEIKTHGEIFSGMKALVDSQARIIDTQSRLSETLARVSDTQLQQKFLMRDMVRELREARRDRREALGLPPEEDNGGLPEPNGDS